MKLDLPRIYPITDTEISGLSHHDQVKLLLDGGASLIQLRDKSRPARAFFEDAAASLQTARAAGAKIIINDRVDIALALRADGVHLGQSDMPVDAARRLLGSDAIIGFSTHNIQQVEKAVNLPIDYLAFGPVYSTSTKLNPDPVAGTKALGQLRALVGSLPIVGIGGINRLNVAEVLKSGADSAAIISAILAEPRLIAKNLKELSSLVGREVQQK